MNNNANQGLDLIRYFHNRTESAASFSPTATPWVEIFISLTIALKRQLIISCPYRTLLYVIFGPNALHWAELSEAFSLKIKFQPLIRINS